MSELPPGWSFSEDEGELPSGYRFADAPIRKKKDSDKAFGNTEGMSSFDQAREGAGAAIGNMYLGAKQLFNIGDQENLQDLIDVAKKRENKVTESTPGKVGQFVANTAAFAPVALIPGANGIVGGTIAGGAMGALTPTASKESPWDDVLLGAGFGAAGPVLGKVLGAGYKGLVRPWFEGGRRGMVGDALNRAAGSEYDDILKAIENNSHEYVPGSLPTLAEASANPSMARIQKTVRNKTGESSSQLIQRERENALARRQGLLDIAGTDADMFAAKAARGNLTRPLYDQAGKASLFSDDALNALLDRPSLRAAEARAENLAKERGDIISWGKDLPERKVATGLLDDTGAPILKDVPAEFSQHSGKGLQYLKMALDDMLDNPKASGIGSHEEAALQKTRAELMSWLEQSNPDFISANRAYAQLSRPINQMEVGKRLFESLTPPLAENSLISRETANKFAHALRNEENLVKQATGQKKRGLRDVMTPRQQNVIDNTLLDLQRAGLADDLMKAKGSDTAQNLLSDNFVESGLGSLVPKRVANKIGDASLISTIPKAVNKYALSPLEDKIQGLLSDAVLDPKFAAELMRNAKSKAGKKSLLDYSGIPMASGGLLFAD